MRSAQPNVAAEPRQTGPQPAPHAQRATDFACDFTPERGDLDRPGPWWDGGTRDSRQLRPGVYCAAGRLRLTGADIRGTVTFVAMGPAARIELRGSGFDLHPYHGDTLLWSEGQQGDAIRLSGSGGQWRGIVAAPHGRLALTGERLISPGGLLLADTIRLTGSGTEIHALTMAPEAASATAGAIHVQKYLCATEPTGTGQSWYEACAPQPTGIGFRLTPVAVATTAPGEARTGTTDGEGRLRFEDIPPGTYDLEEMDGSWCHAESDRVDAQGQVIVEVGEVANVWIFNCQR